MTERSAIDPGAIPDPVRLPWRQLAIASSVGAMLVLVAVLFDVDRHGSGNLLSLVQPGARGPSAAVFDADFPEVELPDATGHDGQQFYAIARSPFDLDDTAAHLDRPTYRLGRPLLPWLAWAGHPSGGGYGLVYSFLAVGVLATFGLGMAGGAIVAQRGGSPYWALAFPLLPGSYLSVRLSVADALAVALLLATIALSTARDAASEASGTARRLTVATCVVAALAVLAREFMLLPLTTFWITRLLTGPGNDADEDSTNSRRRSVRRRDLAAAASSFLAAGAWAAVVRIAVDDPGTDVTELGVPFGGLVDSMRFWLDGEYRWAAVLVPATFAIGVVGAVIGLRTPDRRAIAAALTATVSVSTLFTLNVIGLDLNGPRTTLPIAALSLAVLAPGRRSTMA